jgi:hypothetical protein
VNAQPPSRTVPQSPPPTVVELADPENALEFGRPWRGDDVVLSLEGDVERGWNHQCRPAPAASFVVENRSAGALSLRAHASEFFLQVGGRRYLGCYVYMHRQLDSDYVTIDDLQPGNKASFRITFRGSWESFLEEKRNPSVAHFYIGVGDFHPRLRDASWRVAVFQ